jgi:hypothetical protein
MKVSLFLEDCMAAAIFIAVMYGLPYTPYLFIGVAR